MSSVALQHSTFLDRIRRFGDIEYMWFAGTPTSEDDARWKWGQAFRDYVSTISPSAGTLTVDEAFHDTLRLELAFTSQPPESDFAAAWAAGMRAMTGVAAGWDPVMLAAREQALRTTLQTLFASPILNAVQRLTDIATAFHTATVGIKSAANPPVVYS